MRNPQNLHHGARLVSVGSMLLIFAAVFCTAWWTSLKRRDSARAWALAASSLIVFAMLLPGILTHHLVITNPFFFAIGVLGFFAFRTRQPRFAPAKNDEPLAIPGDFTSAHLNRVALGLTLGLSLGSFLWWQNWLKAQHVSAFNGFLAQVATTLVVLLSMTSIHELGHALVGMACGMKLRAFFIGPLQWRLRDAKWSFEFKPKGLFLVDGVTALVPGNGDLRSRQYLSMMAAGPFLNVLTGIPALFIALRAGAALPLQLSPLLALFGAWSLGLAAANLMPFRTPMGYSDGAIVLQLVSGGALADFHMSVARIGSSLVSPFRPRDYDVGSIQRAARRIANGRQALLLWLYAFSHSIDSGNTQEADEVLANAELVCLQSASNIPAELHTSFVFGNALVRRDPKAARFWWNRMQKRNPRQLNADYWRAESALHWIEGNLEEARRAWDKSNALAANLPNAGAYDFSRHCCALLRSELERTEAA